VARNPIKLFGGRVRLHRGDCQAVMASMPAGSVDAIVTDPPYGLTSKKKGGSGPASLNVKTPGGRSRIGTGTGPGGFMGAKWDARVPGPAYWAEALRVAKPGAHLLAFGGTRTFHRLACAIEDAGWEIRDCVMWLYGSGFPKSLDVSKALDKTAVVACPECNATGKRRNPKPTDWEDYWLDEPCPRCKGTGKIKGAKRLAAGLRRKSVASMGPGEGTFSDDAYVWKAEFPITAPATADARRWAGWGTALKPAWEPIIVARKPLEGTVARNVLKHGTGGLNIDGCRVESAGPSPSIERRTTSARTGAGNRDMHTLYRARIGLPPFNHDHVQYIAMRPGEKLGRWPANVIHDGSDEVVGLFAQAGPRHSGGTPQGRGESGYMGGWNGQQDIPCATPRSEGSAARFFYCAKASKAEREEGLGGSADQILARSCQARADAKRGNVVHAEDGAFNKARITKNSHPTVKPVALMRYLCRLVTPPDGVILDPFMGSGSTGKAAIPEGFRFIGIDEDAKWVEIARLRIRASIPPLFAQEAAHDKKTTRRPPARSKPSRTVQAGVQRASKRHLASMTSYVARRSARGERQRPAGSSV